MSSVLPMSKKTAKTIYIGGYHIKLDPLTDFHAANLMSPTYSDKGSYGYIYLYCSETTTQIAKLIPTDTASKATGRELTVNSKANHPNICSANKIFHITSGSTIDKLFKKNRNNKEEKKESDEENKESDEENKILLIMDFLACTVNQYVKQLRKTNNTNNSVFDINDHITVLVREIVYGVDYLHQSRVMHRDIKDGNILISMNGDPKIVDHGFAREIDDQNKNHTSCRGTAGCIAPENYLVQKDYDQQTDDWSIGILWAQLMGYTFDILEVLPVKNRFLKWIEEQKEKLEQHLDGINYQLKDTLLKLLETDVNKRLKTKELLQILNEYIAKNEINVKKLKEERIPTVHELAKVQLTEYYMNKFSNISNEEVQMEILKLVADKLNDEQKNTLRKFLIAFDCDGTWISSESKEGFTDMFKSWLDNKKSEFDSNIIEIGTNIIEIGANMFCEYKKNKKNEINVEKLINNAIKNQNDISGDIKATFGNNNNNNSKLNVIFEDVNQKSKKRKAISPLVKSKRKKRRKLNNGERKDTSSL